MGKIGQGILGGLSGKVGNVVGASWKGINYIRIKPVSVANPRTLGQVNQRTKFSATLEFLQPSLAFLKIGYKFQANKQTAFNAAMSYILKNAITGTSPDFTVDYALALMSRGSMTGASGAGMEVATNEASISWTDYSGDGNARLDDKAMMLAYNAAKKESIMVLEGAVTRQSTNTIVALPATYAGDTVHFYLAFQTAEGTSVFYVGEAVAE